MLFSILLLSFLTKNRFFQDTPEAQKVLRFATAIFVYTDIIQQGKCFELLPKRVCSSGAAVATVAAVVVVDWDLVVSDAALLF